MNMMLNEEFAKAEQANASETDASKNPALARMMKAWESKQAKNARKATGLGLVAVSLAACGGSSSSDDGDDDGDTDVGQVFTLTTGVDTFTGGDGDDVFNAPLADASGSFQGLLGIQTLGGQDILIGGEGRDTLNAELNATGTTQNPTLIDIEVLNFTVMPLPALGGIFGGAGIIDLSRSEGYEEIWNINSQFDLTVFNVGESAAIGLDGVAGGTTYTVAYTSSADISEQLVIANAVGGSAISAAVTGPTVLDVTDPTGAGIEDLNLIVSNGVRLVLDNSVANIENLDIDGSGTLVLSAVGDFQNLVTLNSTGYNEDLMLDISGSGTLESVLTGAGDDVITAAAANFSADTPATTVDLGAGDNRLILQDSFQTTPTGTYTGGMVIDEDEISALDFTLGTVSNVQTLELVDVNIQGDASLALEGVGGLETLVFDEFNNSGNAFTITGSPETLLISATDEFEMDGGLFTIEGAVDLTVETTGTGDSDVRLDGGVNSTTLETLVINAADDAELIASDGLDALTSIEVNGLGDDADVTLNNFTGDEFGALESVSVTAFDDAELTMNGRAPVAQVDILTFSGTSNVGTGPHDMTFNIPGIGNVTVEDVPDAGGNWNAVATYIAAELDGIEGITVTSDNDVAPGLASVTITRDVPGEFGPISLVSSDFGAPTMTSSVIDTLGIAPAGFEALENVVVDAGDDAEVTLVNVYGDFTVDVTAEGGAFVTLDNTTATSANVSFGTNVVYDRDPITDEIIGFDTGTDFGFIDTFGDNSSLESITISGAVADPILTGDLTGLKTIDLTGVTEQFIVDASTADFGKEIGGNDFVTYLIGGTSSDWEASPGDLNGASFIGSSTGDRETFKFTDADFGTVVIDGFNTGGDGDRIDLSDFGFTNKGQLAFDAIDTTGDDIADSLLITDDASGPSFSGSIILTGITDESDLSSANFTFA